MNGQTVDVYENGEFNEQLDLSSSEYEIINKPDVNGVSIININNNKELTIQNIVLSEDKMSFTYDAVYLNNTYRGLVFNSPVELPDTPVQTTMGCCDWDQWFSDAVDAASSAWDSFVGRAGAMVESISEAIEHMSQQWAGQQSPCPDGTGREYGYDEEGRPYNRCV